MRRILSIVALLLLSAPLYALDNYKNFSKSTLSTGISAADTSVTVASSSSFPAAPFNATIWNYTDYREAGDDPGKEIVRVTAVAGNTFTITRAQEGTAASAHNTSGKVYRIIAPITAKLVTDISTAISAAGVTDATFITQTAHATLTAEQAMSALGTGIVKNTTGTGVQSIAVAGDFPTLNQSTTGNAATSTALAADPVDCSSPNFALGVNASGTAQCAQPVDVTGNSATATALAANPTDCAANQFATTIAASGNLTCAQPSAANLSDGTTGTGAVAMASSPSFTTPSLGAALATSLQFNGTTLSSPAANSLDIRNAANAQQAYVYNTADSGIAAPTNYERLGVGWNICGLGANAAGVCYEAGGSGTTTRSFFVGVRGGGVINFYTTNATRWVIDASPGNLSPNNDNTRDVGTTTARVRSVFVATSTQGGSAKTLTAAAETAFVQIAVASGSVVSGLVRYGIEANDGTDFQSRSGTLHFTAVNKAGTESCSLFRSDGGTTVNNTTDGCASSKGASKNCASGETDALTNTFTCTTTPTNGILLNANAVSDLVETTLRIVYNTEIFGGGTTGVATVTNQ